jgi:hypothetical protein
MVPGKIIDPWEIRCNEPTAHSRAPFQWPGLTFQGD